MNSQKKFLTNVYFGGFLGAFLGGGGGPGRPRESLRVLETRRVWPWPCARRCSTASAAVFEHISAAALAAATAADQLWLWPQKLDTVQISLFTDSLVSGMGHSRDGCRFLTRMSIAILAPYQVEAQALEGATTALPRSSKYSCACDKTWGGQPRLEGRLHQGQKPMQKRRQG